VTLAAPVGRTSRSAASPSVGWVQARARVARHLDHGVGHRWLDLDVPRGIPRPAPGQFMQLLLEAPAPVFLPRPMSVAAAAPAGRALRLGFLYAPVGAGTHALAQLPPGAAVEVLGPLGRGFPLAAAGTPVLIAGGRGVAPMLFAAEALARAGRGCAFLFGARDRTRLVGLDEARRRIARMRGQLHVATDDGSRGTRGTVMDLLARLETRLPGPWVVHACGPHAMLAAVARWGLARRVPTFLAMESVMACGTGVCRGCPLPRSEGGRRAYLRARGAAPSLLGNRDYAMCCTEGPVFPAEALDWERVE
jgi:dihydroorotate dehydrogenase electron transfer subunit